MKYVKSVMYVCLLAILLTPLLAVGVARSAGPTCGTWSIVPSPNVGSNSNLLSVAAVSASNVWAVGDTSISNGFQTLIEHWNGTSWQVVKSPNVGANLDFLSGVAAISASNVWAVGYYYTSSGPIQTLIEHWNGTSWQVVKSPNVGTNDNTLSGVAAVSASNIWAVGYVSNSSGNTQTLIEHWNGTSWQVVNSPSVGKSFNFLSGVAAVSASNIWAVGYYSTSSNISQTLIEHWKGTNWQFVKSPNVGKSNNILSEVAAISASNVWAVGYSQSSFGSPSQTLIEHWNGTSWQVVKSPNVASADLLYGVAAVSASNVWAAGNTSSKSGSSQTLIEHWNGSNWQVVKSPNVGTLNNNLNSVSRVPGSSNIWAVGSSYNTSGTIQKTLTEFYC